MFAANKPTSHHPQRCHISKSINICHPMTHGRQLGESAVLAQQKSIASGFVKQLAIEHGHRNSGFTH
jgi:hypothetical protein